MSEVDRIDPIEKLVLERMRTLCKGEFTEAGMMNDDAIGNTASVMLDEWLINAKVSRFNDYALIFIFQAALAQAIVRLAADKSAAMMLAAAMADQILHSVDYATRGHRGTP